jgi:hypothetical protein
MPDASAASSAGRWLAFMGMILQSGKEFSASACLLDRHDKLINMARLKLPRESRREVEVGMVACLPKELPEPLDLGSLRGTEDHLAGSRRVEILERIHLLRQRSATGASRRRRLICG